MRKIIQIAECDEFLHALCDDGRVYKYCSTAGEWRAVPDIPQDSEEEQATVKRQRHIPYQKIADLYNEILGEALPQCEKLTATRKQQIKARCHDLTAMSHWRNYFEYVTQSKFLMGQAKPDANGRVWRADFDWLIRESSFVRVSEGKYHD